MITTTQASEGSLNLPLKDRLPKGREPRADELPWVSSRGNVAIIDATVDGSTHEVKLPYQYNGPKKPEIPEGYNVIEEESVPLTGLVVHAVDTQNPQGEDSYRDIPAATIAYCSGPNGEGVIVIADETNADIKHPIPGKQGEQFISALTEINRITEKDLSERNLLLANSLLAAKADLKARVPVIQTVRGLLGTGLPASNLGLKLAAPPAK